MENKKLYFDEMFKLVKNKKRDEFRKEFLKLHERDQADFFHELYPENKRNISELLLPDEFAELFEYMDRESQWESIKTLPELYLAKSINLVADNVLVEFIDGLEENEQEEVFGLLNTENFALVTTLLHNDSETAAAIMTTQFFTINVEDTADKVINTLRGMNPKSEILFYLYCVDDKNHLQGVVSLRDLLLSPVDSIIKDLMNKYPVYVSPETDQEEVAKLISDYDLLAIPVVQDDNVLLGIVTVDDVMDIMEEEFTEDFHKFSGIMKDDKDEDDTILSMAKNRLPWIIILLFLGLISAKLIGHFEETLSQVVALAAFMPIILDSAGNVGTQSLAVSVRRLTLGDEEKFSSALIKELVTGAIIGVVAGAVITVLSLLMYGDKMLGLVVGVSLGVTLSLSTVIGYAVPKIFNRLAIDPAVASGPFITTLCDTFALNLYFGLATLLLI